MGRYLLRRLVLFVPVWLGVATLVFLLVRMSGDPVLAMVGDKASPERVAELREKLGLDRPLPAQYASFLGELATGDLGESYRTQRPVLEDLRDYFPATLELTLLAMLFATAGGMALGIAAAVRRNGWVDSASMVTALVGVSVPVFWLALLALKGLGESAGLFPVGGRLSATTDLRPLTGLFTLDALLRGDPAAFADAFGHLVLPACVLATVPAAIVTRMTRAALIESLGKDYVRTARAKGLRERTVVVRHALRNSLIPILTVVGMHFGLLLGGAVLTETVFGWPGLGKYTVDSVLRRDFRSVQGALLLMATTFVVVNLLVDLLYGFLDPRVREGYEEGR
ncbi:MAG: ABC transporter permease [Planctomycetaceae bacterium]|nr:ABC transporter permease [Planctomycetota bacterium]NUN52213.1 ABC transporter permease [Planctomycetaceae bacterium]